MNKVSSQFIQDTIPPSTLPKCARCLMLKVKIEQLQKRMQGWDKAINEVKIESIEEFMNQVISNQFYNKDVLINFYRNWIKGLEDGK